MNLKTTLQKSKERVAKNYDKLKSKFNKNYIGHPTKLKKIFNPSYAYTMQYKNPISNPHIFDSTPHVIFLGFSLKYPHLAIGINFHWLSSSHATDIWNWLLDNYTDYTDNGGNPEFFSFLLYDEIKSNPKLKPLQQAIRAYDIKSISGMRKLTEKELPNAIKKFKSNIKRR